MAVKRYNGTAWVTEAGAAAPLPSGMLAPFAGSTAPTGWLLSDGSAVSRTTYSALFTAIGTTYGTGDGSTTFNLPDLRGRTPFGKDDMGGTAQNRITSAISGVTGTTLGAAGGDQRLHAHDHPNSVATSSHVHAQTSAFTTTYSANNGYQFTLGGTVSNQTVNTAGPSASTTVGNNTQGGTAQNLPPAIILNYIIKV